MTLLVVALLTVLAIGMNTRSLLALSRAKHSVHALQAGYVLRSGISTAMVFLDKDARESVIDTLNEIWAQDVKDFPVGDGTVSVRVDDEAARFNVNTLVSPQGNVNRKAVERFARLLRVIGDDDSLAPRAAEWLRSTREPLSYAFRDPSEILLVPGVTRETFERLSRHVTVATDRGNPKTINVNTVSREVLAALSPELTGPLVDRIIGHRTRTPFTDIGDLKKVQGVNDAVLLTFSDIVDVRSSTFSVRAEAKVADVVQRGSAVVRRDGSDVRLVAWKED